MTRREAIEALEYLISGECADTQMDYVAEIQMAINDMKICEANNTICAEPITYFDAQELLKEQEPVKPKSEDYFGHRFEVCGNCGNYIMRYEKYCPECGRKVDWDDNKSKGKEVVGV